MDCIAHQAPLSMDFSMQEYWSGWTFPSPGDLPHTGIEHMTPALQTDSLPSEPPGKLKRACRMIIILTPLLLSLARWLPLTNEMEVKASCGSFHKLPLVSSFPFPLSCYLECGCGGWNCVLNHGHRKHTLIVAKTEGAWVSQDLEGPALPALEWFFSDLDIQHKSLSHFK